MEHSELAMVKIKEEVDEDITIEYSNENTATHQISGSDKNSNEIGNSFDEYKVFIKTEPDLEIFDGCELQNEIKFGEDTFTVQLVQAMQEESYVHATKKYSCLHCGFWTNRKDISDNHNEVMHSSDKYPGKEKFSCQHCDYKTNHKLKLKRHMVSAHMKEERSYSCYICDFKTYSRITLQLHRTCHTNPKSYSCTHCNFECPELATMRTHERTHLIEKSRQKMFFCAHCDYRSYFKFNMKEHMKLHLSERPQERMHSCSLCDFKTKRIRILKIHHRRIHLGEEPFRCPVCHQTYSTNGSLSRHLKIHSRDEHSIQCTECDYKTLQNSSLIAHMKTHSRESFTCSQCSYKTYRKFNLDRHKCDSENPKRKSYPCGHCQLTFEKKILLKQHMNTH